MTWPAGGAAGETAAGGIRVIMPRQLRVEADGQVWYDEGMLFKTHRRSLLTALAVAVVWSLAGLARGDAEAALLPWALPTSMALALIWERGTR